MKINKELLKGSTIILVLTALADRDAYGYQLIKDIEETSKGAFTLREGTLYPILHALESDGLIESYWVEKPDERKRRYYQITREGRKVLKEKREEWVYFKSAVDRVLAKTFMTGEALV